MMLSYEYLNDAVELSNSKIPVLVIENKIYFSIEQITKTFDDEMIQRNLRFYFNLSSL